MAINFLNVSENDTEINLDVIDKHTKCKINNFNSKIFLQLNKILNGISFDKISNFFYF